MLAGLPMDCRTPEHDTNSYEQEVFDRSRSPPPWCTGPLAHRIRKPCEYQIDDASERSEQEHTDAGSKQYPTEG